MNRIPENRLPPIPSSRTLLDFQMRIIWDKEFREYVCTEEWIEKTSKIADENIRRYKRNVLWIVIVASVNFYVSYVSPQELKTTFGNVILFENIEILLSFTFSVILYNALNLHFSSKTQYACVMAAASQMADDADLKYINLVGILGEPRAFRLHSKLANPSKIEEISRLWSGIVDYYFILLSINLSALLVVISFVNNIHFGEWWSENFFWSALYCFVVLLIGSVLLVYNLGSWTRISANEKNAENYKDTV